jgi:hypothetical protein
MYGMPAVTEPAWLPPTTPALTVAPDPVDLSGVAVGDAVTVPVVIRNARDVPVELLDAAIDPGGGPFSSAPERPLPVALAPDGSVELAVTFAPTAAGTASAVLRLTGDDPDAPEVEVPVSGVGIP